MPQRSAVSRLSLEHREELERRLLRNGFSDYDGLAAWLNELGYEITKSSVHRHGHKFQRRMEALRVATEQAKSMASEVGDDEGAMNEALIRMVQSSCFELLLKLQELQDEEGAEINPAALAKIGRMVADLTRSSISQKKWADQVRSEERERVAKEVGDEARALGVSDETIETLRKKLMMGAASG